MFWKLIAVSTLVIALATSALASDPGFDAGRAPFAVRFGHDVIGYREAGVFALPAEALTVDVLADDEAAVFDLNGAGAWHASSPRAWTGRAPATPGAYRLEVTERGTADTLTLNLFVMVPATALTDERLEGYRIGRYPTPLGDRAAYRPPAGFVRVTPELASVRVAPHFTIGQFLTKQAGGFPKFVVLRTALLLKLERLLEEVNAAGRRAPSLFVMSGFRTPFYNQTLGNTPNSRHVFGDAADVFVDADGNGRMDDLNGDGRYDRRDAEWLLRLVDRLDAESGIVVGGAGPYPATSTHGPFVHVDARGTRARW